MAGTVTGGCLCGAVTFELTLPVKFCAHCHCSLCRRAHGAPLVTFCGVPNQQFRLTAGEGALREYHSSPAATRSFCSTCGTTLLFRGDRWPGDVHVAVAAIDGDIGKAPHAHVYYDDRAPWFSMDDDLVKLGGKTGVDPID